MPPLYYCVPILLALKCIQYWRSLPIPAAKKDEGVVEVVGHTFQTQADIRVTVNCMVEMRTVSWVVDMG